MSVLKRSICAVVAVLAVGALSTYGQNLGSYAQKQQLVKTDAVKYLFPEQVSVPAGKPAEVALHFSVASGLHINSHTPTDEFLIPTTFSIPSSSSVRLQSATYPPGTPTTLPADPSMKLSVYTGEFVIRAHIVATAGNHLVEGQLHYQACDNNQCMPPKTIQVAIDVIGK